MSYSEAFHNQDGATKAAIYDNMHDHMEDELSKEKKHIDPEYIDIDQPGEAIDYGEKYELSHDGTFINTSKAEPLKPDDHMTMIEMINWYNQMVKKKYDPAFILKQLISRYSITRK